MSSPARTLLGKEGFDDGAGKTFKGLVLGASQSGKSSLIQRFAHN
jgi:GTPase SAR1 family protein